MHTGRRQADDNITFSDVGARKHGIPFDCADSETRKVVIVTAIHARHFRRFAADQGATGLAATDTDTGDNGRAELGLKLSAGVVVEKEQGLCTLHDQVVHAHCNQIDADGVVPAGFNGNFEFRADAVRCCDENRIPVAGLLKIENSAKAADLGVGARPRRCPHEGLDQLHHPVAGVDINTGLRVSESAPFFCHDTPSQTHDPGRPEFRKRSCVGKMLRRGPTLESQVAQWSRRRYTLPEGLTLFRHLTPGCAREPGLP